VFFVLRVTLAAVQDQNAGCCVFFCVGRGFCFAVASVRRRCWCRHKRTTPGEPKPARRCVL